MRMGNWRNTQRLPSGQLQLSPSGPAVTVYTESLSVDDITQSKLEFGQPGMRFVGLGQEATFSSLSSHCFLTSTQPSTEGRAQKCSHDAQEQPVCSANSHLTEVTWGLWQGTNPLQRLLCQNTGRRGAWEMGTDGDFRVSGQVTCQHPK